MIIKNVWYIAAHSEEVISNGVLARTIAGERMVFCRRADGSLFALEDRCPHRLAPLSLGEMVDGHLRCGYHGATFEPSGRCVRVPGQETVPEGTRVRSFPVKETYGYVWVWPGDPALSGDESSIPSFLKYGCPPYAYRNGHMLSFASDYKLVVDNLLDPTHAEFVHRTSFGSSDWQASRTVEETREKTEQFVCDMREDRIDFTYYLSNVVGGPCFGKLYALLQGKDRYDGYLDMRMEVNWTPPGLFSYALFVKPAGGDSNEGYEVVNLHLLTPETERTCHYLYRCSTYAPVKLQEMADTWFEVCKKAFLEDKRIIEGQQRVIGDHDLLDHPIHDFDGDAMSLHGRRILQAMLEKEEATESAYA